MSASWLCLGDGVCFAGLRASGSGVRGPRPGVNGPLLPTAGSQTNASSADGHARFGDRGGRRISAFRPGGANGHVLRLDEQDPS